MKRMNEKIKNIIVMVALASALGIGGWYSVFAQHQPHLVDFVYERDNAAVRTLFMREWDWLVPVPPEDYSLDLVLKHRAPQQNPLYAGRLHIKVLRQGEQLLGFVAYYLKGAEDWFFNFLAVDPTSRGKGYGERLARAALNDMIARGARRITIVTYPFNERALRLYTRLGFKEIDRHTQVELEYQVP
jgi:ribosomal protein S18 acetylase RimI-like enzyme